MCGRCSTVIMPRHRQPKRRSMAKLGRDESELQALGALWTAREIAQQPAMLRKTHAALVARKDALDGFLRPLLDHAATRVILTGAGTSAFIGEIHHLAITCNPDGALARKIGTAGNGMAILLPEETHDRSFAMTSSFSCMTCAALAALSGIDGMAARVDRVAQAVEAVIETQADAMKTLAGRGYARVVYLGSHIFKGLAREAALKLLELTDGGMIAAYDSPLGFRHGPKTIVNDRTLVVIFLSNDAYTRRYDLDLLDGIRRDGKAGGVLVISGRDEGMPAGLERILIAAMADAEDVDLLIPFIAAPQIFAFEQAIGRGLSPDNPNVSGTVNRVVQGVRIHAVG